MRQIDNPMDLILSDRRSDKYMTNGIFTTTTTQKKNTYKQQTKSGSVASIENKEGLGTLTH